jgi:hypothetical protein
MILKFKNLDKFMKKLIIKILESKIFKVLFWGLNIGVLIIWFSSKDTVGVPSNDIRVVIFLLSLELIVYICLFIDLFVIGALTWLYKAQLRKNIFNKIMLLLAIFMVVVLIYHGVIENLIDFIYYGW